jgi:hypothetical protein
VEIGAMIQTLLAALRALIRRTPSGDTTMPLHTIAAVVTDHSPAAVGLSQGRTSMYTAYEKLIHHLDERDVKYLTSGDDGSICADFRCAVGTYRVIATVDDGGTLFQVFGYSPVRVPEGARPTIAETIARANYGLRVGKFEMDFDEGELRFQAAQILTDERLEDDVIDRLMGTTMSMLDMYLPAILSVIYGNELPKDAVRCVEAGHCCRGEVDIDERGADD